MGLYLGNGEEWRKNEKIHSAEYDRLPGDVLESKFGFVVRELDPKRVFFPLIFLCFPYFFRRALFSRDFQGI